MAVRYDYPKSSSNSAYGSYNAGLQTYNKLEILNKADGDNESHDKNNTIDYDSS